VQIRAKIYWLSIFTTLAQECSHRFSGTYGSVLRGVHGNKKGEVVEPAGGETGVPRCLAEAYMLLYAAFLRYFKKRL